MKCDISRSSSQGTTHTYNHVIRIIPSMINEMKTTTFTPMYSKFLTPNVKYLCKLSDDIGNEKTSVQGRLATARSVLADRR